MRSARLRPALGPLEIIHDDPAFVVIHKPAGLLTSTVPRERRPTAIAMLRAHFRDDPRVRIGVIHRLDRDAAGLLVFSKNDDAYRNLKGQFFHHTVDRIYHALTAARLNPPAGSVETRLVERADGTVHSTKQAAKGQRAVTEYTTLRTAGKMALVRVRLLTGRKHQIRVHLSERGAAIVGDHVYGEAAEGERLMLAATTLAIDHPLTGKRMTWTLPLAEEMRGMLRTSSS